MPSPTLRLSEIGEEDEEEAATLSSPTLNTPSRYLPFLPLHLRPTPAVLPCLALSE